MDWWKTGIIYQIYPRSFCDTKGDGVGDLEGIRSKLGYLEDLGVSALWLSPVNVSPMSDFGYDISDYRDIDPVFGSLEDFDALVADAHDRGIRIMMDMVFNHSSHLHPWFQESKSSRDNPKRDWYIWQDGRIKGGRRRVPNNWRASFGGRAWEWDEDTEQYYLHTFLKEQPDLNWRNPDLRKAVFDVMKFWLDRGVDGFRFDVINWFIKDDQLRSNPPGVGPTPRPYDMQKHLYDRNRPEVFPVVREIRELLDSYDDRTSVGEVFCEPPGEPELSAEFLGNGTDSLHMAFDFSLMFTKWNAGKFYRRIQSWYDALPEDGWPCWVLSNHDEPRTATRLGGGETGQLRARTAAVLLMTLRGTPFLYYGEELGLTDPKIARKDIVDPVGLKYWPFHKGRDSQRSPMPWDGSAGFGFSPAKPWVPFAPESSRGNVRAQSGNPQSIYNLFRRLIRTRKAFPALTHGDWQPFLTGESNLLGYSRNTESQSVLVLLNFGSRARTVDLPPGAWIFELSSHRSSRGSVFSSALDLAGNEGVILVKMKAGSAAESR